MSFNIDNFLNDGDYEIPNNDLSNKYFSVKFNVGKYKEERKKFLLQIMELKILHKQINVYKQQYEMAKKKFDDGLNTVNILKATLIEMEVDNQDLLKNNVEHKNNLINSALKLRNNICSICHKLIYGELYNIRELAQPNNIGRWIYGTRNDNMGCKLVCEHGFHSSCIKNWLQIKKNCPNCRTAINIWNRYRVGRFNIQDVPRNLTQINEEESRNVNVNGNVYVIDDHSDYSSDSNNNNERPTEALESEPLTPLPNQIVD